MQKKNYLIFQAIVSGNINFMSIYEQRIIGYVDILGWTVACNDLSQQTNVIKAAESIAKYASNFSQLSKDIFKNTSRDLESKIEQHASIEFSFFSDNFAVSAPIEHGEIIFEILAWSSHNLLSANFLVRGAVTLGELYHKHDVIFGPALIEAVNMEKKADHPRLLCSKKLVEFLNKTDYKDKVLFCDHYQDWIVNITTIFTDNSYALDDFNKIVSGNISKLEKHAEKWRYFQEILPLMHKAANFID